MSLEIIVGMGFISFIYAFLYNVTPKETFWLRFLYLGLCLFSIVLLTWTMVTAPSLSTSVEILDLGNNVTRVTPIVNSSLTETYTTYLDVTQYVPLIVITTSLIIFLYNIFMEFSRRRKSVKENPLEQPIE